MYTQNESTIFYFLLVFVVTAKMLFFFLTIATVIQSGNPNSSTQNKNIKLTSSTSFNSSRLLFLQIKFSKSFFPHWLLRSLDITIGVGGVFESDQNLKLSFSFIALLSFSNATLFPQILLGNFLIRKFHIV